MNVKDMAAQSAALNGHLTQVAEQVAKVADNKRDPASVLSDALDRNIESDPSNGTNKGLRELRSRLGELESFCKEAGLSFESLLLTVPTRAAAAVVETPTSDKIRQRIEKLGIRSFASDNISQALEPGDRAKLIAELEPLYKKELEILGIDWENDPNSNDTPARKARMYVNELFAGRYVEPPKITAFKNFSNYEEMLLVSGIRIQSQCAHHWQPIEGVATVAILPKPGAKDPVFEADGADDPGTLAGLSKYHRLAEWFARRGQTQEVYTTDFVAELEKIIDAAGIMVQVHAEHGCCTNRGINSEWSTMDTTHSKGVFNRNDPNFDAGIRDEFFKRVGLPQNQRHG